MIRTILLSILMAAAAITVEAADSCIDCHGNRQRMESLGYGAFTVTSQEVEAQTLLTNSFQEHIHVLR